jgi:hypothetical protein
MKKFFKINTTTIVSIQFAQHLINKLVMISLNAWGFKGFS